jgi:hypothetical protein
MEIMRKPVSELARSWRRLFLAPLIAGIAMTGSVDTASAREIGKKGSDERGEWCDLLQDLCGDVECKPYKYGEESESQTALDECYDKCTRDYNSCMDAEARTPTVAPAIGKGDTGGVLREPPPPAPDTKGGTVAPSPYGTRKGSTP